LYGDGVMRQVQLYSVMQSFAGPRLSSAAEKTLGQFALVSYIPEPLASFLDELRLELTPGCDPHAHVTILPPRPIQEDLKCAVQQIANEIKSVPPFEVELGDVEVFEKSRVIYISLKRGVDEVMGLYAGLNYGCLYFSEHFPFHPHITIGQNITAEEIDSRVALAREKWASYRGPRSFTVRTLSFVQHVAPSIWADVAPIPMGVAVPVPVG
jgi:2'-5' RNA ligase